MKRLLFILIFLSLSFGLGQTILVDDELRSYKIHLPESYQSSKQYPLFVLLHGKNLSADNMITISGLNDYADQNEFIALYPQGRNKEWNYLASPRGAKDIVFIKTLIKKISSDYSVDQKRIYLAGFSNGGFMAQRLICDKDAIFAAFASVSAPLNRELPAFCPKAQNTSILLIHGTADHILPFDGVVRNGRTLLPSVTTSYEYWLLAMSCSDDITSTNLESIDEETRVVLFESRGCENNQEVNLYAVVNGGHNWPGHRGFIPTSIAGKTSRDIDANQVLWEFFKRHSLNPKTKPSN